MPPLAVTLAVLVACLYLAVLVMMLLGNAGRRRREAVQRRLELANLDEPTPATAPVQDITKRERLSDVAWLEEGLSRMGWAALMARRLRQAGVQAPLGVFVLLSLLLGVLGAALAGAIVGGPILPVLAGLALGALPALWVRRKLNTRNQRFEEQLPEALDLVARSLKAGHTFPTGLSMVAQEFDEPIGSEFSKTLEEINFGGSVQEALDNLAQRVICADLMFFVVSVKIQNETGGNLAEIVENISRLIRERFKLRGRVRVLSAEGRFAAWILCLMPPGIAVVINLINPGYLGVLFEPGLGRTLLYTAASMMGLGVLVISRMVKIKV
uniref:Type II secretion system F family protein n=1 Tax=Fundidesulfovibrio putealis TaxID=270496 RepID=A0A7C4AGK5_9BACT